MDFTHGRDNFYISLPSNTIHSSRVNKTSHYYVEIPGGLNLPGEWEVGLAEISIPVSWFNFFHDVEKRMVFMFRHATRFTQEAVDRGKVKDIDTETMHRGRWLSGRFLLTYGFYPNMSDLIESLNENFSTTISSNMPFNKSDLPKFIYLNKFDQLPILNISKGDYIVMHKDLVSLLKLDHYEPLPDSKALAERDKYSGLMNPKYAAKKNVGDLYYPRVVRHSENLIAFCGLPVKTIDDFNDLLIGNSGHISYYPHSMPSIQSFNSFIYIYSSLVCNEIVGNAQAPLLRSIRCSGKQFNSELNLIYNTIYYKRISKSSFREIDIKICDDEGELVKFQTGKVLMKLHFRKISK